MIIVDGSNALPVLGADRLDDEARRRLVSAVAALARSRRTKAVVVFDGSPQSTFARSLGHVTIRFSGAGSGDDLIVDVVEGRAGEWTLITRDRGLMARVRSRRVRVEDPSVLIRAQDDSGSPAGDDWEEWFSDPANRMD